ncbi:dTDP-4-dehydrorhamnose reductase [Patescibacteria group bacterium]|nr:dTDP-4-dehydrorhamnose reductase [Patescibacteria group bacterium]
MNILIIGKKGMLGHDLVESMKQMPAVTLTAFDREDLDITDREAVESAVTHLKPDYIFNAAAMTNVDACEENPIKANLVNADAVGYLARAAKSVGATLIHYSTDYVFDGANEEGYAEYDKPNPISEYGKSKYKGEQNALSESSKIYIVRVCWLYGKNRENFVDFLANSARNGVPVKLVEDQFGHPTYTQDIAEKSQLFTGMTLAQPPCGIYHLFNNGKTSRKEQGEHIFELLGQRPPQVEYVSVSSFPGKAPRPKYSILKNTKIADIRDWQEATKDYLGTMSRT